MANFRLDFKGKRIIIGKRSPAVRDLGSGFRVKEAVVEDGFPFGVVTHELDGRCGQKAVQCTHFSDPR